MLYAVLKDKVLQDEINSASVTPGESETKWTAWTWTGRNSVPGGKSNNPSDTHGKVRRAGYRAIRKAWIDGGWILPSAHHVPTPENVVQHLKVIFRDGIMSMDQLRGK